MDEADKEDIANRTAEKIEDNESGGSLITTLIVILILVAGGYWVFNYYSKTHSLPPAVSAVGSELTKPAGSTQ